MCGIAGIVEPDGGPSREQLAAMRSALVHRGPDGSGIRLDGAVGLVHVRLAIVDIGGGAQPMLADGGDLAVTFNGEIFNHVELREQLVRLGRPFTSHSDTEVILQAYAAWGDACVERMNGDFAFALHDRKRRRLFCARDRAGVRPFFYARRGRAFLFASEVKALFAAGVPAAFDPRGLNEALTLWSARAPRTVWSGVEELPPGSSLVVDDGGVTVRRYWQLDYAVDRERGDDEAADELLALLDDATRIRLRADVPVGSYLSGGLDSSLVAALAARHVSGLSTFSITFADKDFDESGFQREVAEALGTSHHTVAMGDDDVGRLFPDVVRHAETPMVRTAPAPLHVLAKLVRDSGMKVVLTGEGADEMLGGYDLFKEAKIRRFWAAQPGSRLRPLLLRRLYPWMRALQGQPDAFLGAFFQPKNPDDPLFSHLPRFHLADGMRALFSQDVAAALADHDPLAALRADLPAAFSSWDPFSQAQFLESTTLLPGYLLSSQGDRMAMAHAVEARFPYLDVRVMEFAARLPARQKMRVLDEKYLLKRAARGLVPPSVLARKKQPYRAPDARGFYAHGGERARHGFVDEALAPERVRAAGVLDADAVQKLIARVRRTPTPGARDNMALVFALSTQLCAQSFIAGGSS